MNRVCTACKLDKPLTDFHRQRSGRQGYAPQCKSCRKLADKAYVKKQPERRKAVYMRYKRKRNYGLSQDQFDLLILHQAGVCAICQKPPTKKCLHVDHDHQTGKVRGLLCNLCNVGLGAFKDSQNNMLSALVYLIKAQGGNK